MLSHHVGLSTFDSCAVLLLLAVLLQEVCGCPPHTFRLIYQAKELKATDTPRLLGTNNTAVHVVCSSLNLGDKVNRRLLHAKCEFCRRSDALFQPRLLCSACQYVIVAAGVVCT